jgi:hypothetical protein
MQQKLLRITGFLKLYPFLKTREHQKMDKLKKKLVILCHTTMPEPFRIHQNLMV